jgi:hypothetical protein
MAEINYTAEAVWSTTCTEAIGSSAHASPKLCVAP